MAHPLNCHNFPKVYLKSKEKTYLDISWSSTSDSEDGSITNKKQCSIDIDASLNPEFSVYLNYKLSPIIGGKNLSKTSLGLDENRSPILRRKKFWRRQRNNVRKSFLVDEASPEIKRSQGNYTIDELSPIDIVSYPLCSITPLYHQPPSIRKTRVKKGGLAHQLQKAITFYNASLGFWEHEASVGNNCENCLQFSVIKKWKEFSCTVLQCKYLSDKDKFQIIRKLGLKCDLGSTFLIMVGFNRIADVDLEVGTSWMLFSPYVTKVVTFKMTSVVCCVNVSRLKAIN